MMFKTIAASLVAISLRNQGYDITTVNVEGGGKQVTLLTGNRRFMLDLRYGGLFRLFEVGTRLPGGYFVRQDPASVNQLLKQQLVAVR